MRLLLFRYGLSAGVIALGILLCAAWFPTQPNRTPATPITLWQTRFLSDEAAQPLHPPALLEDAVIWRPLGSDELVYTALDGSRESRHDWLIGTPLAWAAFPNDDSIHLIWRTLEGDLYSALLTTTGDQATAPVNLGSHAVTDFRAVALPDGGVMVGWQENGGIWLRWIDALGRPRPTVLAQDAAGKFALSPEKLVWESAGRLYQAALTRDDRLIDVGPLQSIPAFSLPPDGWLSRLEITTFADELLILWGITRATQPDVETYSGLWGDAAWTVPAGFPLRWMHPYQGGLLAAGLLSGEWQLVRITPKETTVLDSLPPVTASPPVQTHDRLAWVMLDEEAAPRLIIVWQQTSQPDEAARDWRGVMWDGLKKSPRGIVWLILPAICLLIFSRLWYGLPLALAVYWAAKAIVSFGLFSGTAIVLSEVALDTRVGAAMALLLISRVATAVAYVGWEADTPDWVRHAAYFLTDACLTFVIFGVHVQ